MLAFLTTLFVAAAPLPGDTSFTTFALVPLGKPAAVADVKKAFAGLKNCKGKFNALKRSDYPDLSVIATQGRWAGLSEADHAAVENAKEVVDVEILCTPFDLKKVRDLDEAMATAAASTGSAVVSLQTIYSPAAFRDERIDHGWADGVPVARWHFKIVEFRQPRGPPVFTTTGLGRFGIPNLVITQAGRPLSARWLAVVEWVVQRFMEGASTDAAWHLDLKLGDVRDADLRTRLAGLASANAKRAVRVTFVPFVPPDPSLSALDGAVELTFPTPRCKGPDSCGQLALVELFGPPR